MLDFNDAESQQPHYDVEELSRRLAHDTGWVRRLFANGRYENHGKEWRLAEINGRGPGKQGSCVIDLTGDSPQETCHCAVCRNGVPPSLYYVPGYDGAEGHWVSNRPRDCLHYEGRAQDGRSVISTYYDNADHRNHSLVHYFTTGH